MKLSSILPLPPPATCAGFLLKGFDHNLAARLARMNGNMLDVHDNNVDLFYDYTDIAIANGVNPNDPSLKNT